MNQALCRVRPELRGQRWQRLEGKREVLAVGTGRAAGIVVSGRGNFVFAGRELEGRSRLEASVLVADSAEAESYRSADAPVAWRVEAHADLALLRGVGVHAEQDVESLSLFGGDENFDDLLGLNGNRIRRHQARGDAVGARGGSADARDGRSGREGIAAEKRVLKGREKRGWSRRPRPGCCFCRNRILTPLPEQRGRAPGRATSRRDRGGK